MRGRSKEFDFLFVYAGPDGEHRDMEWMSRKIAKEHAETLARKNKCWVAVYQRAGGMKLEFKWYDVEGV